MLIHSMFFKKENGNAAICQVPPIFFFCLNPAADQGSIPATREGRNIRKKKGRKWQRCSLSTSQSQLS